MSRGAGGGSSSETTFESDWLAMWTRIQTDNLASVVSTSWYIATPEAEIPTTTIKRTGVIAMVTKTYSMKRQSIISEAC